MIIFEVLWLMHMCTYLDVGREQSLAAYSHGRKAREKKPGCVNRSEGDHKQASHQGDPVIGKICQADTMIDFTLIQGKIVLSLASIMLAIHIPQNKGSGQEETNT